MTISTCDDVIAMTSAHEVVAAQPDGDVVAIAGRDDVCTGCADEPIVAIAADDGGWPPVARRRRRGARAQRVAGEGTGDERNGDDDGQRSSV